MTHVNKTNDLRLNWTSIVDLAAVVAVLVIVKQSLLPFTQLYAGPVSTLSAMILATVLLKRRGSGWGALGFRWPKNWPNTVGLTVLSMVFFISVCMWFLWRVAPTSYMQNPTWIRNIKGRA